VTDVIRSLAIGITVPFLGGLLAMPSFAQTADADILLPAETSSTLEHSSPASEPGEWPLQSEQPSETSTPSAQSSVLAEPSEWLPQTEKPAEPSSTIEQLPASEPGEGSPQSEQAIELVLQLSERQLYVYRGETVENKFPVAVGKSGWETPTGTFEVSYMLENPGWTNPFTGDLIPPGPENPLGERWISFWTDGQNEIGFHGTPNRNSIGQAASHGCVRLYNEHIRELYELVTPGTVVKVLP